MKTKTALSIRKDASTAFHVQAVTVRRFPTDNGSGDYYCDAIPTDSILLLDEDEAGFFLEKFFAQYYDCSLIYNIEHCTSMDEPPHYEPFLNDNFYTYPVFQKLLNEISAYVAKLQGIRSIADPTQQFHLLREEFGYSYSYFWGLSSTVQDNLDAVILYYQRFIALSRQIMKENPQTTLISVSGP